MWLYVPSTSSASSLEGGGWNSESGWRFQALARSVSWRGKPSPPRLWYARWKRVGWVRALCGRMSPPSTAYRGVESWISSLAASRARTSPSRAKGRGSSSGRDPACGATSSVCSMRFGHRMSSSRTSQLSLLADSTTFSQTLPRWGSMRSGACFELPKPEPRTSAPGSSSSPARWRTPSSTDWKGESAKSWQTREVGDNTPRLSDQVAKFWPTATDAKASGAAGYSTASGRHAGVTLTDAAVRGLLAPTTGQGGESTSSDGRGLNPRFVERLMGWPDGWTACDSWGTESSLTKQPLPSSNSAAA